MSTAWIRARQARQRQRQQTEVDQVRAIEYLREYVPLPMSIIEKSELVPRSKLIRDHSEPTAEQVDQARALEHEHEHEPMTEAEQAKARTWHALMVPSSDQGTGQQTDKGQRHTQGTAQPGSPKGTRPGTPAGEVDGEHGNASSVSSAAQNTEV